MFHWNFSKNKYWRFRALFFFPCHCWRSCFRRICFASLAKNTNSMIQHHSWKFTLWLAWLRMKIFITFSIYLHLCQRLKIIRMFQSKYSCLLLNFWFLSRFHVKEIQALPPHPRSFLPFFLGPLGGRHPKTKPNCNVCFF